MIIRRILVSVPNRKLNRIFSSHPGFWNKDVFMAKIPSIPKVICAT